MTAFRRVKSIDLPSDWDAVSMDGARKLDQETILRNRDLGIEQAELERRGKQILCSRHDFFVFFETALATPEVADAIQNQVPYYFREPGEEIPDPSWGEVRTNFEQWWILTHYEVNDWGLSQMKTKYMIVTFPAFVEFYTSRNINKAYGIIANKLDDLGIE